MADDEGEQRGSFRHCLTLEDGTTVPIPKETFRRLVVAKKLGSEFIVGENHGEAWGKLCRSLWPELVEESELRKLAGEPLSDRKLMERWRSWTDRPIPGTHTDWKHLAHWVGIEVPKDITDEWIEGDLLPALTARKQREADQVAAATRHKQTTEAAADGGDDALQSTRNALVRLKAKPGKKRLADLSPEERTRFDESIAAMLQHSEDERRDWLLSQNLPSDLGRALRVLLNDVDTDLDPTLVDDIPIDNAIAFIDMAMERKRLDALLSVEAAARFKSIPSHLPKQAEAAADDDGKGSESVSAKEKKSESLRPSDQKAFAQYEHAMKQQPTLNTDDEVYDWLLEDAEADDAPLPRRDSWKRMVGRARAFHDQRKNGPRIGNETRSVVSAKRLDTAKRTKTDQR